ncbi:MAG: hypothetical protein AMXMBFR4_33930 [Candidatus Hydrogenedentota bacterium]
MGLDELLSLSCVAIRHLATVQPKCESGWQVSLCSANRLCRPNPLDIVTR